jgi:hypothetical protein
MRHSREVQTFTAKLRILVISKWKWEMQHENVTGKNPNKCWSVHRLFAPKTSKNMWSVHEQRTILVLASWTYLAVCRGSFWNCNIADCGKEWDRLESKWVDPTQLDLSRIARLKAITPEKNEPRPQGLKPRCWWWLGGLVTSNVTGMPSLYAQRLLQYRCSDCHYHYYHVVTTVLFLEYHSLLIFAVIVGKLKVP